MDKDKLEGKFTRAYSNGVSLEVIQEYLAMSTEEAIHRFLSKPTRNKIVDNGEYFLNPQDRNEKLTNVGFCMGTMHEYQGEFCKTKEGKIWYESHVPDLALIAAETGAKAREYSRKIREGEARTRAKTRGHKFIG